MIFYDVIVNQCTQNNYYLQLLYNCLSIKLFRIVIHP